MSCALSAAVAHHAPGTPPRGALSVRPRRAVWRADAARITFDAPMRADPLSPSMQALSSEAAAILQVMEQGRVYEASQLRTRFPALSADGLRQVMHELWVTRQVERFGDAGWRRQESTCASRLAPDPRSCAGCRIARSCAQYVPLPQSTVVRPDQLFDHSAFPGLFK
jgi:hypothetical protein